jgi:hypothetical protein
MTSRGFVENGKVILESPEGFADGSEVQVLLVAAPSAQPASAMEEARRFVQAAERENEPIPSLLERLEGIVGVAEGLPSDMAAQHDHYLHGLPKK